MDNVLVSVIIPVYNVEKYLENCINSILLQDYKNMEIILIDDGSPDRCPQICDNLATKDSRIKVIHQTNGGSCKARNTGIDSSTGDYIMFVDSDDCLDGNRAVSVMVKSALDSDADIVVANYKRLNSGGVSGINDHCFEQNAFTDSLDFRVKGFYYHGHLAYNWGKLYKKSFLINHSLYIPQYPFAQDKAHNIRCYAYKPKYIFIKDSVYLYRVNDSSVTAKYKKDMADIWINIAKDYEKFLKTQRINDDFTDLLALHVFFGLFFVVKQEIESNKKSLKMAVAAAKNYSKNPYVRKMMKSLSKESYVNQIKPLSWKIMIRTVSRLFCMKLYVLIAFGIWILEGMKIDKKITKSRYKK